MISLMMQAARTSETSVDSYFTLQYIPEGKSEQLIFVTVKCGVIFEVRTEFLNVI
jgi:hypothetical protein